jgi:hypothetical protein
MSPRLADAIFWVAVACCAIAQAAILKSVIVAPARGGKALPSQPDARRVGEIAWAILPGFALAAVFVYTWRAMR